MVILAAFIVSVPLWFIAGELKDIRNKIRLK